MLEDSRDKMKELTKILDESPLGSLKGVPLFYDSGVVKHDGSLFRINLRDSHKNLAARSRNKFKTLRVQIEGKWFHSKREAIRFSKLKFLEKHGAIQNLITQPKYPIVINGKVVKTVIFDFAFIYKGVVVVEDEKGAITSEFRTNLKLVRNFYPKSNFYFSRTKL